MARQRRLPKGILRPIAAGAALVFLLAGGLSCDLFDTRKPTDPGSNTFPCDPLTTPGNVFANIAKAYGRGDGLSCYLSTLSDSIVFDFDDADSLAAPAQYANWRRGIEQRDAQNVASGADSFFLQLKSPVVVFNDPGQGVQTIRYTYEIQFKGSAIPDTLFQGLAEITVRKNAGGQWLVGEWVDRPDPGGTTSRTWGYLRGAYRIGF